MRAHTYVCIRVCTRTTRKWETLGEELLKILPLSQLSV